MYFRETALRRRTWVTAAGALALGLTSLAASAQQLTISAAASMTNVLKDLGARYESAHPGVKLQFNFAASGVLLQQISQGAPVDLFISADEATVDKGIGQKLFDAPSRKTLASNAVVLILPAQDPKPITGLADLYGSGVKRIAVGKVASVPVGRYTKESLESVHLWGALEPKFVFADSVRQVLDYVARGEVDAGFVYSTDAAIMPDKVKVVMTVGGHKPVTYPMILVSDGKQKVATEKFAAYLLSPPAQKVLAAAGFGKP